MTIIFILFVVIAIILLIPSQLMTQQKPLADVEASLSIRLQQLKSEFQLRTKELARRLKSGELAQQEWQQMNDELQLETTASIESTHLANSSKQTNRSLITGILMVGLVVLMAFGIYTFSDAHKIANKQINIIDQLNKDPQFISKLTERAESENTQETLESLFLALRSKVDLDPNDVNSWRALAMFNSRVGRNEDAYLALRRAIKLTPNNIDIQVELAQYYASSKNPNDVLKANSLLLSLIKQNPDHEGARLVFAFNALGMGLYQDAIDAWQYLLNKRGADSASAKMLQKSIDFATQKMAASVDDSDKASVNEAISEINSSDTSFSETNNPEIKIAVNISETIRQQLSGDETLFVFAKAVNGPRFPLAVVKYQLSELPSEIILTDANAMQADIGLSKFAEVNISARISKSGDAINQPDDINSEMVNLKAPYNHPTISLSFNQLSKN